MRMFNHAKTYGGKYKYGEVKNIISNGEFDHEIELASGEKIQTRSVVIATGMVERIPESIKGIHEFEHKGVSYCVICDGPLFKGKNIAIIGGGNAAIEEAQFAAQFANHVYVFVRTEKDLIADKISVEQLKQKENVTLLINAEINELIGSSNVEKVIATINGESKEMDIEGVFPYIGQVPVSAFAKSLGITDERGYIPTDESMETKVKGIYAIGDIRKKDIRQIATAASDGTIVGKILANRL
uniref:FAD/NAD(P)-binding domain-containing protein n=1 Tax=Biomphalaria glabrata TaxID=6526 RepID=A0A2C9LK21_BIOGL